MARVQRILDLAHITAMMGADDAVLGLCADSVQPTVYSVWQSTYERIYNERTAHLRLYSSGSIEMRS